MRWEPTFWGVSLAGFLCGEYGFKIWGIKFWGDTSNLTIFPLDEVLFTLYIWHKRMSQEDAKNMESKTPYYNYLFLLTEMLHTKWLL